MKEITQPDIMIPDFNDEMRWALFGRIRSDWLKHVSPQLGLDTEKIVLADVLESIVFDDSNGLCFFVPEITEIVKDSVFERLDWEIGVTELPQTIRDRLEQVMNEMIDFNWYEKEGWQKAKDIWLEARNWIKEEMDRDPKLIEALRYMNNEGIVLKPYYLDFLNE